MILKLPIIIAGIACLCYYLVRAKAVYEKTIGAYIIFGFFFEIVAIIWSNIASNNLPGLHLYTLGQFIITALFFNSMYALLDFKFPRNIYLFLGSLLIVTNSIFVQSIFTYNSYSKVGVEMAIIIQAISVYLLILKKESINLTYLRPALTFLTAILLNASVSIVYFLYSKKIMEMDISLAASLNHLRALINIITQILFILVCYQIYDRSRLQNNAQRS